MNDECPQCYESDETEYVITQQTEGAVGVYCWRCEALSVFESAVEGNVGVYGDV